MLLSVEVPDLIAKQLRLDGPLRNRRALEMFALEGYRAGELSRGQVSEMLGLGFHETEQFLHDHGALLDIRPDEFNEDATGLTQFLPG